MVVQAAACV